MSDAERKSVQRARERDLRIPKIAELNRRADCLADTQLFLRTYFNAIFYQPFTETRSLMADGIERAARYGGDQAIAGPRGDGKTRLALFVTLKLILEGAIRFPIIISKSGSRAGLELDNFKKAVAASELLLADFPEVVYPIVRLGRWASKARQQTAFGEYTNLEWGEEHVVFPRIPSIRLWENGWNEGVESTARGQIVASLGIEGPVRGYSINNERPDLSIMDDIDDRESARSELQTATREMIIEEDVGGLGGPDKTIARVFLCTKINNDCNAAIFTNRKLKPSWRGQCHKWLAALPLRMDLWEEYIALRKGRNDADPDARKATEFYKEHFEEMNAGAVVTNPYRYDPRPLEDGEPGQLSALQACFDIIADRDWDHFNTEYQNDPPIDESVQRLVLTAHHIQHNCLSGLERRHVPEGTVSITIGADVQKLGLHYVVIAWDANGVGCIIDYDFFEFQTKGKDAADCEILILEGLFAWHDALQENPFIGVGGEAVWADRVLIDMGWKEQSWNDQPVQIFCAQVGFATYLPSKGTSPYNRPKPNRNIALGDNWHWDASLWTLFLNTDHWKLKVHEGFLLERNEDGPAPGSLLIFDHPEINGRRNRTFHMSYSKHILAETWETRYTPGFKGSRTGWWKTPKPNHYLDATYEAIAARPITGVDLLSNPMQKINPAQPQMSGASPIQSPPLANMYPVHSRNRW